MRDPLLLPAVAFAVGILSGRMLGFSIRESGWLVLAFFALAILAHFLSKTQWLRATCALLAMLFIGVFTYALHRPGQPPQIDAGSKEIVLLEGCVVEPPVFSPGREQFTLDLDRDARARVSLAIDNEDAPKQRFDYGQLIEIDARIRPPHNYNNPGSFDYANYLARQKIFWTATMTRNSEAKILPGRCGSRFMSAVYRLRSSALERIEVLYPGDTYSAGMMEAILIGETSKLEKVWTENFRRTGTYHALVISGIHVTVLAGVLLFLLRLTPMSEISALMIAAAGAWLYALVSGMSAPVVRAAGGFTLYTIARFFFRRGRVMNLLAAVALVYLLFDPEELFDASFQLSFLCVAAIGALASPLLDMTLVPRTRALRHLPEVNADAHLEPRVAQFRVELRLIGETIHEWTRISLRWILIVLSLMLRAVFFAFEIAVITTVVQIGLALPMAVYFHRISFSGLTANVIIAPVMEAMVPIGFLAIFTGWHWPAALTSMMLRFSARAADWHARIEPSWRVPDPPLWLALAFVASLVVLAVVVKRGFLRWPTAACALALFILLIWAPWPARVAAHMLELTAIDVGQGDSLFVVFPEGARMIVDGGGLLQYGRKRHSNLDTGEDVVSPYLWTRGIRRVDIVVATHPHEDHVGGLASILENFRPRELWTGANPPPALLERAAKLHIRVLQRSESPPFDFSGAHIQILSPPPGYETSKPGNNDSLAFRISYGTRSFLLTGDMEKPMEARLLFNGSLDHADVLKVGHHGSKTSTTQPFLDAVSPSIAVISAGFENSFGHPTKEVLARLADRHAAILRTDLDGLITVRTDGQRLWFDTMRAENGGERIRPVWMPDLVHLP